MKFLIGLLLLISTVAMATGLSTDEKYALDHNSARFYKYQIGTRLNTELTNITAANVVQGTDGLLVKKTLRATYDFAVNGGAQGNISLGQSFPANAIIEKCYFYVKTQMSSATNAATIALKAESSGDIYAAATAHTPTAGSFNACIETGTPSTYVKTTQARPLTLTIANGENLTAGKFVVFCDYSVAL